MELIPVDYDPFAPQQAPAAPPAPDAGGYAASLQQFAQPQPGPSPLRITVRPQQPELHFDDRGLSGALVPLSPRPEPLLRPRGEWNVPGATKIPVEPHRRDLAKEAGAFLAPGMAALGEPPAPPTSFEPNAAGKVPPIEDPRLSGVGDELVGTAASFLPAGGVKAVAAGAGKFLPAAAGFLKRDLMRSLPAAERADLQLMQRQFHQQPPPAAPARQPMQDVGEVHGQQQQQGVGRPPGGAEVPHEAPGVAGGTGAPGGDLSKVLGGILSGKSGEPITEAAVPAAPTLKNALKTTTRGIGSVNLREMPLDEAIKAAQTERHLIRSHDGGFVGAPNWVQTPQQLKKMRSDFDRQVAVGAHGGRWYSEGQKGNVEIAGPDPARQSLLAREEALWSAQATPDTNLGALLQGHNAYEAGKPLSIVRTGAQARGYQKARDTGTPIPLGRKTGVYGGHLDPTMENPNTGTNDIWHARAFGYKDAKGNPWGLEGSNAALTPQMHSFLDAETLLATARANQRKIAGRNDWTPGEVQAAAWVAAKGKDLAVKRFGGDMRKGLEEAQKGYPAYFDKYTAHGTHEAIPGAMTEHLPGLSAASQEERAAFSADPRSSWAPQGRDVLYDAAGMYQRKPLPATGLYTPPGGKTEMNPATVSRPFVGLGGETGKRSVDEASRSMMTGVEAARAYVDAQGAGAWSKPIAGNRTGDSTSVMLSGHDRPRKVDEMERLKEIGGRLGLPDVVDYGGGTAVTSFGGGANPAALSKGLKAGGMKELEGASPGGKGERVQIDSGYVPYEEAWQQGRGSGAVTRELQKYLTAPESPALLAKLDASPGVRKAVLDRIERDIEHSAKTGRPVREDLQKARQIIASEGFAGLFRALARGAALPAALVPILYPLLSGEQPVE